MSISRSIEYTHTMEDYSSIKKQKKMIHTTWMNFKIMPSKRSQRKINVSFIIPVI